MESYKIAFGKNLKSVRQNKNLTQATLAKKIGVSVITVSRWETGRDFPEKTSLKKLTTILGVKEEELLGLEQNPDMFKGLADKINKLTEELLFLVEENQRLKEELKKKK